MNKKTFIKMIKIGYKKSIAITIDAIVQVYIIF